MIINPYAFASVAAGPYLDQLGVLPRSAHGLRKLISTATKCMDVRNRGSGATATIGFSGDSINVAQVLAVFSGSDYVDITRLYDQVDQTSAGYHFDQATVAKQPSIVVSGAFQNKIKFSGSQFMGTANVMPFGTPHWSIYSRKKFDAQATRVFIEQSLNASGSNPQAAFLYSAALNRLYPYCQNAAGAHRSGWVDCFNTVVQHTFRFNRAIVGAGEFVSRQNGAAQLINGFGGTTEQTGNFNANTVYLGGRGDGSIGAVMDLDNLAQYDVDTSAYDSLIEAIIGVAP
ncbi:hypothetical protein LK996_15625 [Lysobacter sp. A6]|uniref:Uncharacterized protein n=1 Tax=Noviluteimonas lactosilytica TaxID=2888523 RepID=A0ABS8JLK9_9GAMM|nr:hypothetical protein [Lysobacter lactosilyticus]MCC8364501.1 hypothetical protein [Lysobacter lactosilyticus]